MACPHFCSAVSPVKFWSAVDIEVHLVASTLVRLWIEQEKTLFNDLRQGPCKGSKKKLITYLFDKLISCYDFRMKKDPLPHLI